MYTLTIQELADNKKLLEKAGTKEEYKSVFALFYQELLRQNTDYRLIAFAQNMSDASTAFKIVRASAEHQTKHDVKQMLETSKKYGLREQTDIIRKIKNDMERLQRINRLINKCSALNYVGKKRLQHVQKQILSKRYPADILLAYIRHQYETSYNPTTFQTAFLRATIEA